MTEEELLGTYDTDPYGWCLTAEEEQRRAKLSIARAAHQLAEMIRQALFAREKRIIDIILKEDQGDNK